MLTNSGLNGVLADWSAATPLYVAVGTGTIAATVSDTALDTEVDRVVAGGQYVVDNQLTVRAFFANSEAIGTLAEVGLFTAPSGGTCLQRKVLASTKEKTALKGLIVDMTIDLINA